MDPGVLGGGELTVRECHAYICQLLQCYGGGHEMNNNNKKKKTMSLTFCNFSKFEARLYLINVLIETSFYIPINFRNRIIANTWLYRYLDCDQF